MHMLPDLHPGCDFPTIVEDRPPLQPNLRDSAGPGKGEAIYGEILKARAEYSPALLHVHLTLEDEEALCWFVRLASPFEFPEPDRLRLARWLWGTADLIRFGAAKRRIFTLRGDALRKGPAPAAPRIIEDQPPTPPDRLTDEQALVDLGGELHDVIFRLTDIGGAAAVHVDLTPADERALRYFLRARTTIDGTALSRPELARELVGDAGTVRFGARAFQARGSYRVVDSGPAPDTAPDHVHPITR